MQLAIFCDVLQADDPVSEQAVILANHLIEKGHRVTVLAISANTEELDTRLTLIVKGNRPRRLWLSMIPFRRWIRKQIDELKPDDTISMVSTLPASIMTPVNGTLLGRTGARHRLRNGLIDKLTHLPALLKPSLMFMSWLERGAMRSDAITQYVALSPAIERELVESYKINASRIESASITFPAEKPDPASQKQTREQLASAFGLSAESYWIVLPFNDPELDGFETAIRSFVPLIKQGVDATLLLAGPTRYTHLAWIGQLGLRDHVRFIGKTLRMQQLMSACDLVLNPTSHDPLGLYVIQAVAAGKPLITTRASGAAQTGSEAAGTLLTAPVDPESLLDAVLKQHKTWEDGSQSPSNAAKPPSSPPLGQLVTRIIENEQ